MSQQTKRRRVLIKETDAKRHIMSRRLHGRTTHDMQTLVKRVLMRSIPNLDRIDANGRRINAFPYWIKQEIWFIGLSVPEKDFRRIWEGIVTSMLTADGYRWEDIQLAVAAFLHIQESEHYRFYITVRKNKKAKSIPKFSFRPRERMLLF